MLYSNLHTHTVYSDGKHTVEENILSAIDKGMVSLGFSDHSCTDFDFSYCIKTEKLAQYVAEIPQMREKYRDQIEIYLGLECDGYTTLANRKIYDYIIADCHYVKHGGVYFSVDHTRDVQQDAINNAFGGDALAYAKAYFATYAEIIPPMHPDILGHFDLCTKFGLMPEDDPEYMRAALEALDAALSSCKIFELNTGAISRGYKPLYPAPYLLNYIREHGGKINLSSDSHHRDNLIFYFNEAAAILADAGFDSVVILHGGKWEEVGISEFGGRK